MISTILPPGKYYIGDSCYALPDFVYENIYGPKYEEGVYEHNGLEFVIGYTAYGDGLYNSNDHHEFCVDAGNISIIPFELCESDEAYLKRLGWIYEFTENICVCFCDGMFTFNDICINTRE